MSQADFLAEARVIAESIVADRRTIHQQPELAYKEEKTAALVADRLRDLGLEVRTGVGGTGVVGVLTGGQPGKTVLLRADMDALPILEKNETVYCSQNSGVMHACGHDGHTAMLLGVAQIFAARREELAGNVKFMFQPAEEGGFGALRMLEQGLLETEPEVDGAFALHVDSGRYTGQIALLAGPSMAAADRFTITVKGEGGHASRPHQTVDPIVVACHIVTALQTIVSREVAPQDQAVVTIGRIESGTASNVIPDTATIAGTVRTYSPTLREQIQQRLTALAAGVATAMRAEAETDYRRGYPPLVNHASGVETVRGAVHEMLGPDAAVAKEMTMGAEDFAYVLEKVPGAMFYLGVRNRSWPAPRSTHSASFDLDEEALPLGTAVMAATAVRFLNE
jgi:amidohydrolase